MGKQRKLSMKEVREVRTIRKTLPKLQLRLKVLMGRCSHTGLQHLSGSAISHPLDPDAFAVFCPDCGGRNTLKKHDFCEKCFGRMIHLRTRDDKANRMEVQQFACSKCGHEVEYRLPLL